ncbi:MAG: ATP-binding protein [bacterium]
MSTIFKNSARLRYSVYGAAFGGLFPLVATLLDAWVRQVPLSISGLLWIQSTQPLHWIIDTAPLFLGAFASLAGHRQDHSTKLRAELEQRIAQATAELKGINADLEAEIARHRKAQAALQISERKFHDIALSSADWIWEVDHNGIYTFASGRVKEILGYEPEYLIGKSPFDLMPEDEAMRVGEMFQDIISKRGPIVDLENWNISARGTRVCLLTNGVPTLSDNGELLGYRGIDKDITEKKLAREQRLKLQEELERARRMESIGLLAGGVAHDLNNMLGPLVGYPDLLLAKLEADSPMRRQIQQMGKCARQAADVIQDLLTLARRGRYEMTPTDLADLVREFLDSPVFLKISNENPDVVVQTALDQTAPRVSGSPTHLSKVIMNLVINSFEAMPDGGKLTIETTYAWLEELVSGYAKIEEGDYVILKIRDSGHGLKKDALDKLFEPYYSNKKVGPSGTGLGLSVVYGIVKDHKGYYDVFSAPGQGTDFVLYLPVSKEAVAQKVPQEGDYRGIGKVLVVDDIEDQRDVATALLSDLGYKVSSVNGGREAIRYLQDHPVDVVILDMIMEAGFDGYDTYREMLRLGLRQKVVIASGYSETDRVAEMRKLGADSYVRKPYTRNVIGRAVKQALGNSQVAVCH